MTSSNRNIRETSQSFNLTYVYLQLFKTLLFLQIVTIFLPSDKIGSQIGAFALDPLEDFVRITSSCRINEVVFVETKQKLCTTKIGGEEEDVECGCEDTYFFTFNAPELSNATDMDSVNISNLDYFYRSRNDVVDRGVENCLQGQRVEPRWSEGSLTECWMPRAPDKNLTASYNCGNEECIKIFSPILDAIKENTFEKVSYILGIISLGLVVPVMTLVICLKQTK